MIRHLLTATSLCLLLASGSCSQRRPPSESGQKTPASALVPVQSQHETMKTTEAARDMTTPGPSGIQWIHNDFQTAREQAGASGKPLMIDFWADWCHTCLSMKKGTLRDTGLAPIANSFVWLSVDTEDPSSAKAMEAFPPKVWPTFLVVSPKDNRIQASQLGSCSPGEFLEFAKRGEMAHRMTQQSTALKGPLKFLREADIAMFSGDPTRAAEQYSQARLGAPKNWPLAASARKGEIAALHSLPNKKACGTFALLNMKAMRDAHNAAGADFMYYASDCASALEPAAAKKLRERSLEALLEIAGDQAAILSDDDRSDALATCRGIAVDLGLLDLASSIAVRQSALLDAAVAKAVTPLEAMTYTWHRVEVSQFLGKGKATQMLKWVALLEAKLPDEYDPPYRRAWLLNKLGRYKEAHQAIAIAAPLAHGARRGRILSLDADIYKAQDNTAQERRAREAVVDFYKKLPDGMASPKKLARAQEALASML